MKKTLIIVDHPHFDASAVNRRWLEEVRKYPDEFTIHNLQSSYPRQVIDPSKEHSLLENLGNVVFEFPIYWFNSPPLVKSWFDIVLTRDWAYGRNYKLEHKKIAFAVTCGSAETDYAPDGKHHVSIAEYLNGFTHAVEYVHAQLGGIYAFFGAGSADSGMADKIADSARGYVNFLRTLKDAD